MPRKNAIRARVILSASAAGRRARRSAAVLAIVAMASLALAPADVAKAQEVPTSVGQVTDAVLDAVGGRCDGELTLLRPEIGDPLCTHGDDENPAAAASGGGTNRADGPVPRSAVTCPGDGLEGPSVEVLSLRGTGQPGAPVADVRRWVEQVEWTVKASAARWNAVRTVRWVTQPKSGGGCEVVVRDVQIATTDLRDFTRMVSVLRARGYDSPDRKYLIFAADDTYCGLASAPRDDRAGADNAAENRAGYGRVDRPCWGSGDQGFNSVAAHELIHTLGAVQDSAPHALGTAHCSDEWDVLCYADGGGAMQTRCVDSRSSTEGAGDHFNRLLDCNGDDYFRPNPPAGSYLATHWNVADSRFLSSGSRRGSRQQSTSFRPPFRDDDDSPFEDDIVWLVGRGVTNGCGHERFCPTGVVSRGQMAAFLSRALDLPPAPAGNRFHDDDGSPFEDDIERVAAAGITDGCGGGRYCPRARVTRGQMAAFLARAFDLPPATPWRDTFRDDDDSPFESDIERLAAAGITGGCSTGRFCPHDPVTRGSMAAFLARSLR